MFHIRIALSIICLYFTAAIFIIDVEAQESQTNNPAQVSGPSIVWQKELDGEIWSRSYIGPNSSFRPPRVFLYHEPDVGISPDSTRANPVSMIATTKSIYLFDGKGNIDRRIPLKVDPIPDEVKALTSAEMRGRTEETLDDYIKRGGNKRVFRMELPTTDPKGRFYIIRTQVTRGYDGWGNSSIRAFNVDGSLRFELKNRSDEDAPVNLNGEFYISPNGDYMVIFYNGHFLSPFAFFDIYDTTTGAQLKHVSNDDFRQYDFEPVNLSFSEDGSYVMLQGSSIGYISGVKKTRTLLIFDGQGDLIQLPEDARAKPTAAPQAQHSMKQEIYRQLIDPQVPLSARPKEVRDVKMLTDRNRGVYTSGNTLYLFESQPSP